MYLAVRGEYIHDGSSPLLGRYLLQGHPKLLSLNGFVPYRQYVMSMGSHLNIRMKTARPSSNISVSNTWRSIAARKQENKQTTRTPWPKVPLGASAGSGTPRRGNASLRLRSTGDQPCFPRGPPTSRRGRSRARLSLANTKAVTETRDR